MLHQGRQVSLIYSPHRADSGFEAAVARLPFQALERLSMRRGVGLWDVTALHALNQLIRRLGPFDVVHGHSAKAGALVRLADTGRAARIYTPHALPMMAPAGPGTVLTGMAELLLARRSTDALICVSDEEAAVARRWRLAARAIPIIPNGLAAAPALDRDTARGRLGLSPQARAVGFVGRLCKQKDPVRFARAVRLANALDPRVTGVVIGCGPLAEAVRSAGGQAVTLAGALDARPLMAGLDLLAVSSRYEAGAYAMIEAAAAGLPMVSTAVGGAQALAEAGASIDILPVDAAPDQIARAMLAGLARPKPPVPASPDLWSAARMAEATARVYEQAIDRRSDG